MDERSTPFGLLNGGSQIPGFLELDIRELTVSPALARFQLRFLTKLVLRVTPSETEPGSVISIWGDVLISRDSAGQQSLGRARLEPVFFDPPTPQGRDAGGARMNEALIIDLDRRQLDAIEELRRGGDLVFTFTLRGMAHRNGEVGFLNAGRQVVYRESQSNWTKLLGSLGYSDYVTVEVPVPGGSTSADGAAAVASLKQALAALGRAEYEEAVADCRAGLKALCRKGDEAAFKLDQNRAAGKEERFWRVSKALLTVAHVAHHPEDSAGAAGDEREGPPEQVHWDRADAVAVVSMLAALCRQRLGQSSTS